MDITRLPRGVLSVLFVATSALVALLLIPSHFFFPSLGLAFLFIAIASLAFAAKKRRTVFDFAAFVALLLLSSFLVFRANFFLNFLDVVTILFLGAYFLSLPKDTGSLISFLFFPITRFLRITKTKNIFPITFSSMPSLFKNLKIAQHLPSLLITILLLFVVTPLLSYANPFFQKLVDDVIKTLDLTWFFKSFTENFFVYLVRLLVFTLALYLLPRGVSDQLHAHQEKPNPAKNIFRINLLLPKIVLSCILVIFFITQLQLYLSSPETLKALGYTNSQYAREVFAQLSIVAFIIFILMYADKTRDRVSRFLTVVLIVEGVFLCSIALKSVYDYTQQYGFTSKRLYGYAGVAWIFGLLALFTYHYYKDMFQEQFVKRVVAFTASIVLCINFANFDYIIYHYAKPRVFGVDHVYLSRLSPDSDSYEEELPILMELAKNETNLNQLWPYRGGAYDIINHIEYLQRKYKNLSLGSFNFSEYKAYQKTKHLDTVKLMKEVDSYQITPTPVPVQINSMPADSAAIRSNQ